MIEQIVFYSACFGIWAFFRLTTSQQRSTMLQVAMWIVLAFGAAGFVAEVVMRGGRLPISW